MKRQCVTAGHSMAGPAADWLPENSSDNSFGLRYHPEGEILVLGTSFGCGCVWFVGPHINILPLSALTPLHYHQADIHIL